MNDQERSPNIHTTQIETLVICMAQNAVHYRLKELRQERKALWPSQDAINFETDLITKNDRTEQVRAAIAKLGRPYSDIILWSFFENIEVREIASRLKKTLNEINKLKKAALQELQLVLRKTGISDR